MAENNTKRGPGHGPGGPRGGFRKPKDLRGTLSKLMGYLGQYKALLVIVALAVCSYFWHRDADPEPTARDPWIGIAMLPVMIAGAVVGIAALAVVTF